MDREGKRDGQAGGKHDRKQTQQHQQQQQQRQSNRLQIEIEKQQRDKGQKKGVVLVHCKAGISRSPSVVVGYLLHKDPTQTVAEALAKVQLARPIASPNEGFVAQLEEYRTELLKQRSGSSSSTSEGNGTA